MAVVAACLAVSFVAAGADNRFLWELGTSDNDDAEFALAPSDHASYRRDGFFVVGQSETRQDWPYVQPGPADREFGGKPHTFTILFGVKAAIPEGRCRLVVDLINTHYAKPPELEVAINESAFHQEMPLGADDAAFYGEPAKGKEHCFEIAFPANLLKPGPNEIRITTISGSMILYDWLGLEVPTAVESEPLAATLLRNCRVRPHLLVERDGALLQPVAVELHHSGAPVALTVAAGGREVLQQSIDAGTVAVEILLPACEGPTDVPMTFRTPAGLVAEQTLALRPARKLEIYLLPHSHVDIGYTHLQTEVERDHWGFIERGIAAAQETGRLSPGARFKWNVEVLWAVDSYLQQASPAQRSAFAGAVTRGQIGLDAFYCHELAGLCRQEELMRLLACARRLSKDLGVPIESAMVTDCAGLTWGAVPVLAQSGVKYLSLGPNAGHRTGFTRDAWDNRPFWWTSPCGRYKVLCWQTDSAYQPSFSDEDELGAFLDAFDRRVAAYPYDILYYRYCKGDNRGPDEGLSAFVEEWNTRFAYPRLIIATTAEVFRDFEQRYGEAIPSASGDFSPYWEDGAASSARETALNRAAAERLVQAEVLWSMRSPAAFPEGEFDEAWRDVVLYDEHTWGARSYVGARGAYPPGSAEYDAQWRIKQGFSLDADATSRNLLARALDRCGSSSDPIAAVDVINTSSWPRSGLVTLPKEWGLRGEAVRDGAGHPLRAQRLASGELAVMVSDVPAFGAARLTFHEGAPHCSGAARAEGTVLDNGLVRVSMDESTGVIRHLRWEDQGVDLVDPEASGINSYHYVEGFDPAHAASNGSVSMTVKDAGPVVASLTVESDAPGCHRLVREVRIIDGSSCVDVVNLVDKKALPLADLLKAQPQKEGYHFGFAFNVPDGVMRVDMPWSVVRPEADQLPGSCKNWLSVQRWVDVSNQTFGVTWATVDAPIVEVGAISAQPADPFAKEIWRKHLAPTQSLYSYVMNNYWTTNYQHDQEGLETFRYALAPHGRFDAAAATRFGTERSQPLLAVAVDEAAPVASPLLDVTPAGVIVTTVRPLDHGGAWLVRLFGISGRPERVDVRWGDGAPARLWVSDPDGMAVERIKRSLEVHPFEIVTLRIERR
ncbi:MAG TPA: polysaccharide lyase family protein [Candidatus Hydrogenedentes bacterium]|nr:polysaccharide lyase family protein [Candidatus Hydrogenedentota bacterium]HPG67325.1 polysaccharide lyase family protein [Candidatus Hydrogenedentota bacterium]